MIVGPGRQADRAGASPARVGVALGVCLQFNRRTERALTAANPVVGWQRLSASSLASPPEASEQVPAGCVLRAVLTEVPLTAAFKEEDEPATAAVLQHVRLISTLAIEGHSVTVQEQLP